MPRPTWIFAAAMSFLVAVATAAADGGNFTMPWMCLQRCGNTTAAEAFAHARHVCASRPFINYVSFEKFNLGANSTLVDNTDLADVGPVLRACGLRTVPMVSSFPYPPQFLDWMRQLFAAPAAFVDALRAALAAGGYDGVNVDFEPTVAATAADAQAYAAFLTTLRTELGRDGRFVTVDTATWNSLWNFTALSAAMRASACPALPSAAKRDAHDQPTTPPMPACLPPGYVVTMSTYTNSLAAFQQQLAFATANVAPAALTVGLQTWPLANETEAGVAARFAALEGAAVCRLGVWKWPPPPYWLPHLERFAHRCGFHRK